MRDMLGLLAAAVGLWLASLVSSAASDGQSPDDIAGFLGTWRGSSTCTDRVAAPACQDEVVVYEVRSADRVGVAKLAADKVVEKQRIPMGEFEFSYDKGEGCWRAEFETPRIHGAWCLVIRGTQMTGKLRLLPGGETVRKVQLSHE